MVSNQMEEFISIKRVNMDAVILCYACTFSMNFVILINVQMPTIVGILTFIRMLNIRTTPIKHRFSLKISNIDFFNQFACFVKVS